jgi:type IV secretion system protein VirB10
MQTKAAPEPAEFKTAAATYAELANHRPPDPLPRQEDAELARLRDQLKDVQGKLDAMRQPPPPPPTAKSPPPDPDAERRKQQAREAAKQAKEELKAARMSPMAAIRHDKEDEKEANLQAGGSPLALAIGTVLPCTIRPALNSESPGQIVATIREHVRDSLTGDTVLIPQGTTLTGMYNSASFGQERVNAKWELMQLPGQPPIKLDGLPASEQTGQNGLSGEYDPHWGRMIASIFIGSTLRAAAGATSGMGQAAGERASGMVAQDAARETDQRVKQIYSAAPTIKTGAAKLCAVMLQKPLVGLKPWTPKES